MKFNTSTQNTRITRNYEGAPAYLLGQKEALYAAVVTSTLSNNFYEKGEDRLARIQHLIQEVAAADPQFIAKLAIYARENMHLRSVPLVLLVELARLHNGDDLVRRTTRRVIQRVDEITELLACYQMANGRFETKKLNKLSNQLQKGIADAFNRFDEYQFAKYNRATAVKLRDALFLVHPKAKDAQQQQLFDKIVSDTLAVPYTWETALSKAGQQVADPAEKQQLFAQKWEELVLSGKLGYMALLRNLRNLLEANISAAAMEAVVQKLADPEQVRRSKQLPFRFLAAYRELRSVPSGYTPAVLEALESAVLVATEHLQGFAPETRVVIASDTSGSMQVPLSARSSIQLIDVGILLSMLLQSRCKSVTTGIFGTDYQVVQMPRKNVLTNVERVSQVNVGWATNGYKVIEDLIHRQVIVDKVMLFTDCQLWNSQGYENTLSINQLWQVYKRLAPKAKMYLFDLAGYGTTPLNTLDKDVFFVAGWSDKIFDVLSAIENGSNAIAEIERTDC